MLPVPLICLTLLLIGTRSPAAERIESPLYTEPTLEDYDFDHWAFHPVERPPVPQVEHDASCRTSIDRFILARIEAELGTTLGEGVAPLPEADRYTLLRRVTFDLTGLPPTLEAIRAFVADDSPDAYDRIVDRLLASPAYGERWAQHWLDLARFAETDGFEHDLVRPSAWRYRDWVIDALNADLAYDEFVRLQLAGDELRPGDADALIATGFLLCGPDMPDVNDQHERRHVFLNDLTATVSGVFMAQQFGCAQCHDHVTDPIRQADFYRLRAFFDHADVFEEQPLPGTAKATLRAVADISATPRPSHLWIRGDFRREGPELAPAFPGVLNPTHQPVDAHPTETSTGRRTALAHWLTRPEHPLTARVMMNRLWQHHLGSPLVGTASDWGRMGDEPTHPELLDWLADEFVRRDWSLKAMHRLIVTSAVYRASSHSTEDQRTADPENEFLSHANRRRLSGEEVRDAMLAATDRLSHRMHGEGVRPPLPPELVSTLLKNQWPVTEEAREHDRRSVYLFVRRNLPFPMFQTFDRPNTNASCPERDVTTTAPQSLELLNSPFSQRSAEALASLLHRTAPLAASGGEPGSVGREPDLRVAFLRTWNRPPTAEELQIAAEFVHDDATLVDFCRVLLNANEFLYVD